MELYLIWPPIHSAKLLPCVPLQTLCEKTTSMCCCPHLVGFSNLTDISGGFCGQILVRKASYMGWKVAHLVQRVRVSSFYRPMYGHLKNVQSWMYVPSRRMLSLLWFLNIYQCSVGSIIQPRTMDSKPLITFRHGALLHPLRVVGSTAFFCREI